MDLSRRKIDNARVSLTENTEDYIRQHLPGKPAWKPGAEIPDEILLNNVLSGKKPADARFNDPQTEINCVGQILYANMAKIQQFAETAKDRQQDIVYTGFTNPDTDAPWCIGHGFTMPPLENGMPQNNMVQAVKTAVAAVIIEADKSTSDGWVIASAFPMIIVTECMQKFLEPDTSDFTHTLHKTTAYVHATPMEQIYMDYACSGQPVHTGLNVRYHPAGKKKTEPPMLTIESKTQPGAMKITGGQFSPPAARPSASDKPPYEVIKMAERLRQSITQKNIAHI